MLNIFAGRGGAAARGAGNSFAHLMGLRPGAKKAEDDDACPPHGEEAESGEDDEEERKRRDDESDEDYAKRMKELDAKKGKKGEHKEPDGDEDGEGDEPEDGENPDEDEDKEDAKKVKKAKAEGHGPIIAAARRMERRRCAKILGSPQAAKNVALAAELACKTDLAPQAALGILEKGASTGGLQSRMASAPGTSPRVGSGGGADMPGRDPVAASWDRAMAPFMPRK
jgi:hypothetical protein